MKKNLISVSQLTRDNNVVTEFDSHSCIVKDKDSRQVLLQGHLRNGLYRLNLGFVPTASSYSVHPIEPIDSIQSTSFSTCNKQYKNTCNKHSFCHDLPNHCVSVVQTDSDVCRQ